MSDSGASRPATTSLFAEALSQMTVLFETEIRLVRSELNDKITQAVTAVAAIAVGAVLLVAALVLVLQGIVEVLIAAGMKPFAADFAVGVVVLILGGLALLSARRGLSPAALAPQRSLNQLGKDVDALKGR